MKFPAAIIVLTVGITGASAANRRSRRQAEAEGGAAAAASAWEVPVSNRARRRAGSEMIKCEDEELNGIVHLCFTGPDDNSAGGGLLQPIVRPIIIGNEPSSTGFGGFAFEYDSDSQKVKFKGAAGSTFDFSSCMEYKKKSGDLNCGDDDDRRMQEDVIEEDRRSYCDGDDTVLYCPMTPGQCATFELIDTVEDCQSVSNSSGSGSNSGSGRNLGPGPAPVPSSDGIQLHVTTPGLSLTRGGDTAGPGGVFDGIIGGIDVGGPGCLDKDAVAALQCAPNSNNDFMQTSECLHGNNDGPGPLGVTYWLSLQSCSIDIPSPTAYGRTRMLDMGDRRLSLQYMRDRFNEEGSIRSYVDSLGYDVDLKSGMGEMENVLAKEDCEELMSFIVLGPEDPVIQEDYQKYIDESDLVSVIGKDKFNALLDLHKEVVGATIPLEVIKIRHMRGAANSDAFIEYHTDESGHEYGTKLSSVVVALNDNSSIKEGGELYYLREDGPVLASRAQGKAFAHSFNVLHGVSPHVGERVSLILHFNHDLKMEDVGSRKLAEETKRELGCRRYVL